MREIIENHVAQDRFNMTRTYYAIIDNFPDEINVVYRQIESTFNKRNIQYIIKGLIRISFLIELVKPDISSTKFVTRWNPRLNGDPRYADYNECKQIFLHLLNEIIAFDDRKVKLVNDFIRYSILPYELPIDYIERYPSSNRIHTVENIKWFFDNCIKETLEMRKILLSSNCNPEHSLFHSILNDKIKVKTYLTDRALTGEYKTNREKRWETHPNSVQFSFRRECMKIEKTLLLQCCRFEGAPSKLIEKLIEKNILEDDFKIQKCPITGEKISFLEFKNDILDRTHGKSKFQVGHLNPLKAINEDPVFGHTARNISWISEDGNRIQGSLSITEVEELLRRIAINKGYLKSKEQI